MDEYRVLLIEDNPSDVFLIDDMLSQTAAPPPFRLRTASRLADGLALLTDGAADVGLLDLSLPDSHGLDTFEKAHAAAPDLAWIVLTGLGDEQVGVRAVDGGAQDYIIKDQLNASLLTRAIRYAVSRKRAELEHLELRKRLARAERLETAGTVLGQVAHDFGNMLSPLRLSPILIRDYLPVDSPGHQYLDALEEIFASMCNLTDQLLVLARRGRVECRPIHLNDLVYMTLDALKADVIGEGIDIELHLDPQLMELRGSPSQVTRALDNLIRNAVEAMHGRGRLRISTQNVYFERPQSGFNTIERGEYVMLRIEDTGCGIPREIRERIFDPFFSTKDTGKRSGTGLGLSVVHGVIKDHGGRIDVESEVGRGTTFKIYFPSSRMSPSTPPEAPATPVSAKAPRKSILVVDDDEDYVRLVSLMLTKMGFHTTGLTSAEDAIAHLRMEPADMVLMDIIMPGGKDGVAACADIRRLNPRQSIILMSGVDKENRPPLPVDGRHAFLSKPFRVEQLQDILDRELRAAALTALGPRGRTGAARS